MLLKKVYDRDSIEQESITFKKRIYSFSLNIKTNIVYQTVFLQLSVKESQDIIILKRLVFEILSKILNEGQLKEYVFSCRKAFCKTTFHYMIGNRIAYFLF